MEGLLEPEWKEVRHGPRRDPGSVPRSQGGGDRRQLRVGRQGGEECFREAGRDGIVVYDGRIASLRRFKDDARK
jgi:hypothetical protein